MGCCDDAGRKKISTASEWPVVLELGLERDFGLASDPNSGSNELLPVPTEHDRGIRELLLHSGDARWHENMLFVPQAESHDQIWRLLHDALGLHGQAAARIVGI